MLMAFQTSNETISFVFIEGYVIYRERLQNVADIRGNVREVIQVYIIGYMKV